MALSPKDRWKDAGALLAALDDAAAGKQMALPAAPLAAARPRRRWTKIFAAGLAVLLVGGGIAIGVGRGTPRATPAHVVGASPESTASLPAPAPPRALARQATEARPASPVATVDGRRAKTKADARATTRATARTPSARTEKPPAPPHDLFDDIR